MRQNIRDKVGSFKVEGGDDYCCVEEGRREEGGIGEEDGIIYADRGIMTKSGGSISPKHLA